MRVIGLTGGIGSGKTTVANMFAALGVPVYIADVEAKKLTDSSEAIRHELISLLGKEAYSDEKLNRAYVADKIFTNQHLLHQVNQIIHPEVAKHFKQWTAAQKATYIIKEAAILFESGSYKDCDAIILVTAPKSVRIERVMARDAIARHEVEQRMENQWSDEKKRKLSHYIIESVELETTRQRVLELHQFFVEKYS